MKPLRIIQTPVRYYPAIGGVENHVMYLSEELNKLGHKVEVVCANVPISNISTHNGIQITRLQSFFNITNTNITLGLPFYLLKSDFDIIHTHMPTPWTCDWSIYIAKIKRKTSVLTIHNDMQKVGFLSNIITKIYLYSIFKLSLQLVDRIIIVNPDWEKSFTETKHLLTPYKNKIRIIPNGVNTELFKSSGKKEKNSLLFVSVLDKYHWFKGIKYIIQTVKELKKYLPDVHLTIVGEGELKELYQKEITTQNLQKYISFVGSKTQKELVHYFSKASVFVLPSTDTEGFGIVLLEALACGTPIVATNITGVANEVKETNSGIIVKPRDVEQLKIAIMEILGNQNLAKKMSRNGRDLITKKYNWNYISNLVNDSYLELLK